jgi:hypothetical protein
VTVVHALRSIVLVVAMSNATLEFAPPGMLGLAVAVLER